jgi:hypothetical protein
MGGFSSGPAAPPPKSEAQKKVEAAQALQAEQAQAATMKEKQALQGRRRLMRTGGLRLLFSPMKLEGPGSVGSVKTKMGGGS